VYYSEDSSFYWSCQAHGYFVNTTCGAVTVTLPASPTAGDIVAFKDYASQLGNTNNVTLCNNGNKINGIVYQQS
jgi:hypothetical protein